MAKVQKIEGTMDTLMKTAADLRAEISKLSMQVAKMQLKNTTSLRTKKDELARVLTQLSMQKRLVKQDKKEEIK